MLRRPRHRPGNRKPLVLAVLLHVILLTLIIVGVRWQARAPVPAAIQARAVPDASARKEIEQRQRQERAQAEQAARQKREQQERERQAAEQKRLAEQAKLAEQKHQAEAKRQAAAAEKKRKQQELQAQAQKKKEAEQRRQAAEQNLKEQLAGEEKQRADAKAQAERVARAQSLVTQYEGLIRQKVERNWVRPVGWTPDMACVVRVQLGPTGEVIQATVIRPSGNAPFDRSVENAVYRASPLPLPEDQSLFDHFRELELRFRPGGTT